MIGLGKPGTANTRVLLVIVVCGAALGAFVGPGGAAEPVSSTDGHFQVTIDSVNDPVVEGETMTFEVTVENAAESSDTQEVTLYIADIEHDSTEMTLDGGETTTVTLEWATQEGDTGQFLATVSSFDSSDYQYVEVQRESQFDVSIDETNSPVREGETVTVDATIENTGGASDTQEVILTVGGEQRDSMDVTLDSGDSTAVTFEWETGTGDAGGYEAYVESDDDTAGWDVVVRETGRFGVTVDSTNAPVVEGDVLTVDATIENTGGASDTQDVALAVDGADQDATEVTLDAGESTAVTLEWSTEAGDAGTYAASVRSDDDADSTDVIVESAAEGFQVRIDWVIEPVEEGESVITGVTVENADDVRATRAVTLSIDGNQEDSTDVTLDPGETTEITLGWRTGDGDAGEYVLTVASPSDADSRDVRVNSGDSSETTATATPTATPAPTATATPSPTPTATPTLTPAATPTPTPASTASPTGAPTGTETSASQSGGSGESVGSLSCPTPTATDAPTTGAPSTETTTDTPSNATTVASTEEPGDSSGASALAAVVPGVWQLLLLLLLLAAAATAGYLYARSQEDRTE